MSTQELYSATSKKYRVAVWPTLFALSLVFLGIVPLGCLVTDQIDFEDAINLPLEVVESFPEERILTVCDNQKLVFWAVLWDPDIDDPSESASSAHLSLVADTSISADGTCNPPSTPIIYSERGQEKETGTLFYLSCTARLTEFNKDSLVEAKMTISDRGFLSRSIGNDPVPRQEANVTILSWTLKVEDREICNPYR